MRRSLLAAIMFLGALALQASPLCLAPASAGAPIYTFVDEQGVVHFSNRPNDTRYSPVIVKTGYEPGSGGAPSYYGWDGVILLNAREQGVPPALVKAVMAAESLFDPDALSHKGAIGLMQLMPATAASLGVEDPTIPDENVRGGATYLRMMLDRYGDMPRALAAYNAGPRAVDRYRGIPPYRETQAYVRRVLTYYRHYHGDFSR